MGNQEYGTGLVTAYKQVVSDQLGIDADRIDVIMGDTDRTPSGLTGGSRALAVAGTALYEASRTVVAKGKGLASADDINPLGVKGAGEAGAVGAPPAVINAVVDALSRRSGVRHIDMPATPRRVWVALNAGR